MFLTQEQEQVRFGQRAILFPLTVVSCCNEACWWRPWLQEEEVVVVATSGEEKGI